MTTLRWIDPNATPSPVTHFELLRGHGWLAPELHWTMEVERYKPDASGIYSHELGGLRQYGYPVHFWMRACTETECSVLSNENIITVPEVDPILMLTVGIMMLAVLVAWRGEKWSSKSSGKTSDERSEKQSDPPSRT